MIEAEEKSVISSIMDDLRILKKKVDLMEGQIQALADMHNDINLDLREEYLLHLDEVEEKGEFMVFSDIAALRKHVEEEEN
ncbi:MAG: hypothetical protein MUE87_05965 [Methanothrix sp.]|jgi:hypothetical protein|nr:hypothetical protein [Methanothrix sp.]